MYRERVSSSWAALCFKEPQQPEERAGCVHPCWGHWALVQGEDKEIVFVYLLIELQSLILLILSLFLTLTLMTSQLQSLQCKNSREQLKQPQLTECII